MPRPEQLKRILLDHIADKWTIIILSVLCEAGGKARFNAIRRETDGISQKTLAQCLRRLERNGMISRMVLDTAPLGVEYTITPLGHTLEAPFGELFRWAEKHNDQMIAAQERYDSREAKRRGNNESSLTESKR